MPDPGPRGGCGSLDLEAWSRRHSGTLLRLLLLALLNLELGSPQMAEKMRRGFPWPQGLDRFRGIGA